MSQVKEMLLFAAGLVITIGLIFVAFMVFSKALNIGQYISDREDRRLQELRQEEIEKYEGCEIQGNKIVSYVRNVFGKVDAVISITSINNGSFTFIVDSVNINELRNEASAYFINPMKKFKVTISRDKNNSITAIYINQI